MASAPPPAPPPPPPIDTAEVLPRFGAHEGFNRFVLEWHGKVRATVGVNDGVATLSFDRKGHVNTGRLNELLPPSMRPARVRADGSGMTFRVPSGMEVHDHSYGNLVIMDLVPSAPVQTAAVPPPVPAPPIEAAPPPPEAVPPSPSPPESPKPPAEAVPPPTPAATPPSEPAAAAPPPEQTAAAPPSPQVTPSEAAPPPMPVATPPSQAVEASRPVEAVPKRPPRAEKPPRKPPASAELTPPPAAQTPPPSPEPAAVSPPPQESPSPAKPEQTASVEPAPAPPLIEPVPTPTRKPTPPRQTAKPAEPAAKASETPGATPAPPQKPAEKAAPSQAKTSAPPPVQTAVVPAPEAAGDDEPQVLAQTADGQLKVSGSSLGDGFSLRFEWGDSVKAAIFKLRETAWAVFDHPEEVRFNPRVSANGAGLPVLVQSKNGLATVLHMAIPADSVLVAGRAGNAWLLDVRRAGPWQQADTHPQGHALEAIDGLFATKRPGQPVTIVDPDSGEILLAVPVRTAEVHFAQNEDHDSFHVVPTVQGMLFRPETDRFRLLIEDDGARVATLPNVVETRQAK